MTISFEKDTIEPSKVLEPISFGDALEAVRDNLGITKVAMAERLGISKSNYGNVINGVDAVSIKRAGEWAKTLGHSEKLFVRLAIQDMLVKNNYDWEVKIS